MKELGLQRFKCVSKGRRRPERRPPAYVEIMLKSRSRTPKRYLRSGFYVAAAFIGELVFLFPPDPLLVELYWKCVYATGHLRLWAWSQLYGRGH